MLFEFVQATDSDKHTLLKLRKATMTEHLERSGQFLSGQEHSDRVNYQYQCSYLVFYRGTLIGMVKYRSAAKEVELIQIQVDPQHQAKGYGTGIVEQILENEKNKTVNLTVLKDNPAVQLYKKLGFQTVGEGQYEYRMQHKYTF